MDEIVGGMGSDDKLIRRPELHRGPEIRKSKRNGATIVNVARITPPSIDICQISKNKTKKEWSSKNSKPQNETTLLPSSVECERERKERKKEKKKNLVLVRVIINWKKLGVSLGLRS